MTGMPKSKRTMPNGRDVYKRQLVDDQGRYYKSFTETDDKGNMPLLAEKLAEIFKQH